MANSNQAWSGAASRHIAQRIVVRFDLVLETPAHLGNGEEETETDMPLLTDTYDPDCPLLTGTSLGGALRAAVRHWEHGFQGKSVPSDLGNLLFGDLVRRGAGLADADDGEQSPLIIDDSLGKKGTYGIEIRDGVRLNPKSRTAQDRGLYNAEYWRAGTTFSVRLELLLCEQEEGARDDRRADLKRAFALALECVEKAATDRWITLGARKRRGFGVVRAKNWQFLSYDLTTPKGLLAWLRGDEPENLVEFKEIQNHLLDGNDLPKLKGRQFRVSGDFLIDGSLLIRSGSVLDEIDVDMVHLHSVRQSGGQDREVPVLSGTALCGAISTRAWAIAKTIGNSGFADDLASALFGPQMGYGDGTEKPRAGKIVVDEGDIRETPDAEEALVQSRVSIDRFTGGPRESALFNEQPVHGITTDNGPVHVPLRFTLHNPTDAEIGLFLLALKDLATSDLPVGGEVAVARGLLKARQSLHVFERCPDSDELRVSLPADGKFLPGMNKQAARLEGYVTTLNQAAEAELSPAGAAP